MTDKVQKIRKEVERIQLYTQSETLKQVLDYIDKVQEEPVNSLIDFEQELYKAFGQVKDFTLCMQIAKRFYDMGKNSKDSQEFVSEDLEKASIEICSKVLKGETTTIDGYEYVVLSDAEECFKAGAKWQKEQFEKNRLAACDRQTEEEAEIERDFVMGIIEKEHRQPAFDDAIKYGMRLQKEQMIAKAIDGGCFSYKNGFIHISCDIDEHLTNIKMGDKVKVIVIKED